MQTVVSLTIAMVNVAPSIAGRNAIFHVKQETERERSLNEAEMRIRDKEAELDEKLTNIHSLETELSEKLANFPKMDGIQQVSSSGCCS